MDGKISPPPKKDIKNSKAPIRLRPTVGVAYAAHTQDGFDESGSGDLVTIKSNQAESLLFKKGLKVENQILMEGGKWILIPSLHLNYEFDVLASSNNRKIGNHWSCLPHRILRGNFD
mgnify:CR=1 FL=1